MTDFYNKVFKECEIYFKENTKEFLDRQIEAHLFKNPDNLDYPDKAELAKWINISAGLIFNKDTARELSDRILSLRGPV